MDLFSAKSELHTDEHSGLTSSTNYLVTHIPTQQVGLDNTSCFLNVVADSDRYYRAYFKASRLIAKFLECYDLQFDYAALSEKSASFLVWLKSMDNLIDIKGVAPDELVRIAKLNASKETQNFSEELYPEILAFRIIAPTLSDPTSKFLGSFDKLATTVKGEQNANNLEELFEARKMCGRATAESMFEFIRPAFKVEPSADFIEYFCKIGEVGNLTDSAIDLYRDRRENIIGFSFSSISYVKFVARVASEIISSLVEYPMLMKLTPYIVKGIVKCFYLNLKSIIPGKS